ncbi:TPA: glycosyltransferase family 52 [Bacillus tropicus]|uniref:glycosyltransferase family 52 n=1 Tax=Bacillus cereus group TaxID=86661 RepID=UPI00003CB5D9|nr:MULTISPECIES: glycosyltransferase family 52 [Bacillus cereus group]AIY73028.1 glycosyltransferase 52 family protein [Bacillus cereus]AJI07930.1 glycosyltransferase 52 family protein [Bacillus cereus G9241]EAL15988.1 hypothetical protein protein [Bacillus cereus G9241]QPS53466.1 hypothetical protein I6G54_28970 [Bacillus tropicus]
MKKEAVFVCQTPFHILCASVIANKKRNNYCKLNIIIIDYKLHTGVREALNYFKWDSIKINIVSEIKAIKFMYLILNIIGSKSEKNRENSDFYCGNFWSICTRYMLLKYRPDNIFTFDDGAYNLFLKSIDRTINNFDNSLIKRINKIFSLNISPFEVYTKIQKHFSIFNRKYEGIYKEVEIIQYDFQKLNSGCEPKQLNEVWLLTQPFNEENKMSYEQELQIYKSIISESRNSKEKIKIKLHPRSSPRIAQDLGLSCVDSSAPLELLILSERPKLIIGVDSTALITSKLLHPDILTKAYFFDDTRDCRKKCFVNYGVECLNMEL